jgi:hypothetical protein
VDEGAGVAGSGSTVGPAEGVGTDADGEGDGEKVGAGTADVGAGVGAAVVGGGVVGAAVPTGQLEALRLVVHARGSAHIPLTGPCHVPCTQLPRLGAVLLPHHPHRGCAAHAAHVV